MACKSPNGLFRQISWRMRDDGDDHCAQCKREISFVGEKMSPLRCRGFRAGNAFHASAAVAVAVGASRIALRNRLPPKTGALRGAAEFRRRLWSSAFVSGFPSRRCTLTLRAADRPVFAGSDRVLYLGVLQIGAGAGDRRRCGFGIEAIFLILPCISLIVLLVIINRATKRAPSCRRARRPDGGKSEPDSQGKLRQTAVCAPVTGANTGLRLTRCVPAGLQCLSMKPADSATRCMSPRQRAPRAPSRPRENRPSSAAVKPAASTGLDRRSLPTLNEPSEGFGRLSLPSYCHVADPAKHCQALRPRRLPNAELPASALA